MGAGGSRSPFLSSPAAPLSDAGQPDETTTLDDDVRVADANVARHTGGGYYVLEPPLDGLARVRGVKNVPSGYVVLSSSGEARPEPTRQDRFDRWAAHIARIDERDVDAGAALREFANAVCGTIGDVDDEQTWAWLDVDDADAIVDAARDTLDRVVASD